MAKKQDIKEYFRHDYHARNHLKFKPLLRDMGMSGLGIYWCLVEMLYEEGGQIQKSHYKDIAFDLRIDELDLKKVVEDYNLFDVGENDFSSRKVIDRLKDRQKKAKKAAESAKKKWQKFHANAENKSANAQRTHSERSAIIEENRIREERIEENRREENKDVEYVNTFVAAGAAPPPTIIIPTELRQKNFMAKLSEFESMYDTAMIQDFFEYWTEKGETQKKMRFEKEKSFDVSRRLKTWQKNESKFGKVKSNNYQRGKFVQ